MAAVDVSGGRLSFGAPSRQGFPQGRTFGARRADNVFHPVPVEHLNENLAAVHLALYHVVVSFCGRKPVPGITMPTITSLSGSI
jgi:hypothetical protein